MLIKQKSPSLSRNVALGTFCELSIVFLLPISAKLFAENFSKNSDLADPGISLPVFLFRTNLKLDNTSVTPNMVKKAIMNLYQRTVSLNFITY